MEAAGQLQEPLVGTTHVPSTLSEVERGDLKFLKENLNYLFELSVLIRALEGQLRRILGPNLLHLIRSSVRRNFLLGIANLLDPAVDKKRNKNITIKLLNIDLRADKDVTEKIKRFRSKAIAHNGRSTMRQGDDFFTQYGLTYDQVEALLNKFILRLEKELGRAVPKDLSEYEIFSEIERLNRLQSLESEELAS